MPFKGATPVEDEPEETPTKITWGDAKQAIEQHLGVGAAAAGGMGAGAVPAGVDIPPEAALAVAGSVPLAVGASAALTAGVPAAAMSAVPRIASGYSGMSQGYKRGGVPGAIAGGIAGAVSPAVGSIASAAEGYETAGVPGMVGGYLLGGGKVPGAAKATTVAITDAGELIAKIKQLREVQKLSGAQIAAALKQWHGIPIKEATQAVKMVLGSK